MVIQNARPEISGNYTCYIYTPNGEVTQILVITIPNVPVVRTPPRIYSPNPKRVSVAIGEPFSLECTAVGEPRPTVRIQPPSNPRVSALEDYVSFLFTNSNKTIKTNNILTSIENFILWGQIPN